MVMKIYKNKRTDDQKLLECKQKYKNTRLKKQKKKAYV